MIIAISVLAGCIGLDKWNEDTGFGTGTVPDTFIDTDTDTDTITDTDTDIDTGEIALAIDSVTPEHGLSSGGETVTISGGPFDTSATVTFGGEVASVSGVSSTSIQVLAPFSSIYGVVDVEVTTDAGNGALPSAYTYWEDAQGGAGAYGEFYWVHYVGGYWNNAVDFGAAWWTMTTPTTRLFWEWAFSPTIDTCVTDYAYNQPLEIYDINVANTVFQTNSRDVTLTDPDGSGVWNKDLTSGDFVQNGNYGLSEVVSPNFPSFSVNQLMHTPTSFSVSQPAISGQTVPEVNRAFSVQWSGSTADNIVLMLEHLTYPDYAPIDSVTCVVNNDGNFTVPGAIWSAWSTGEVVFIHVGALNEGTGSIDFNNSTARVASSYYLGGAAFTR